MSITYKDAGVDIEKGDALVEKIKLKVKSTYGDRVRSGVGGFACLYEVGDRLLAAGTDGVGTKLALAKKLDKHDTIGIDLVAMCVNDILCTGAQPLFFMDYLATGKLDVDTANHVLDGIVEGCLQSECALIGGETAEMPGMYGNGEYDLAGFAVGEVKPADVLDGSRVNEGDVLIGLPSSGFHSNGYSLVRKLIKDDETALMQAALTPTKIYWKAIKGLLEKQLLNGVSHVTGGGLLNIPRINEGFAYQIVPIKTKNTDGQFGRVDTERMYKNVMEDFKWGGFDNPNVYLDENHLRMATNIRNNLSRLALALIDEGKEAKAKKVLDKSMEVLSGERVPHNYFSIFLAEGYFRIGEFELGEAILKQLAEDRIKEMDYFNSLPQHKRAAAGREPETAMAIYMEVLKMAQQYEREELMQFLEKDYEKNMRRMGFFNE